MEEIWRDVKDYIGLYQVSNWGRVKRLKCGKERILKPRKNKGGYLLVGLYKNGIYKRKSIHILVWQSFGSYQRNGRILQVDHVNNDKTDNRIENLQLLSARANTSKRSLQKEKTSQYTGVSWKKENNKWVAQIYINNKYYNLGYFDSEDEAKDSYQYALTHQEEITNRPVKEKTSQYKGVSFNKQNNKWMSYIIINKKLKHLGYFNTQEAANEACLKAKENL